MHDERYCLYAQEKIVIPPNAVWRITAAWRTNTQGQIIVIISDIYKKFIKNFPTVNFIKRFAIVRVTDEDLILCYIKIYIVKWRALIGQGALHIIYYIMTRLETKLKTITFSNRIRVCCNDIIKYFRHSNRPVTNYT